VEACADVSAVVGSAGAPEVLRRGIGFGADVALTTDANTNCCSLDGGLINMEEVGAFEGSGRAGIPLEEEGRITE
jgi:hypothetical protein